MSEPVLHARVKKRAAERANSADVTASETILPAEFDASSDDEGGAVAGDAGDVGKDGRVMVAGFARQARPGSDATGGTCETM